MSKPIARILFVLALVGMVAYCATHMRLDSDITNFMPAGRDAALASLSNRLVDSELSRTMILTVESEDLDAAVAAVRSLGETLEANPEVAWVKAGIDPDQMQTIYELYFPRRFYFASDRPQTEIPALLEDEGLRARAETLRVELLRLSGPLLKRIAPEDPLLFFPSILERIQQTERTMALKDGVFVTEDGRFAVLFLGSKASAFNSAHQVELLAAIDLAFEELKGASAVPIVLELSGANRIAVSVERSIKADIRLIFIFSSLGVAAIFLGFFRSFRSLITATIPHFVGMLTATTFGLLVFESLNGLAVAFGVSLIGVSIDYSVHLLNHHGLSSDLDRPHETMRRVAPSLILGALTTIVSFLGVAFTDFPGFHQMGLLATVGIGSALLVTLYVLPEIMPQTPSAPISRVFAERLGSGVRALSRHRKPLALVPLLCIVAGAWSYPHLHWVDDLSSLTEPDPALLKEEARVRNRVSQFDSVRFVAALAGDDEAALAINDRVSQELEGLQAGGALESFRSLHSFLWSQELQQENWAALQRDPDLYPRLAQIYSEAGFGDGVFEPFEKGLSEGPPSPLTLEDLRETSVGDLVRSMVIDLGEEVAVLSYLRGVKDPERIAAALDGIEGALYFDQKAFFDDVYLKYRTRTMGVVVSGCFLVLLLLLLRYRALRPAIAAFVPSVLVAFVLVALAACFQLEVNLMHLVGLMLVMGMGVDYGIFIVDTVEDSRELGTTMLSLLLSCFTTIFVFGMLSLSTHPALAAMGMTAGVGVLLAFVLAPVSLVLVRPSEDVS